MPSAGRPRPPVRASARGWRVVFRTRSALSGELRVVERGDERRLLADGDTLSAISLSGDWSRLGGEYWARALDMALLPPRPRALFVGAGGGSQLALLSARARPRWLTVVERDPVVVRLAFRYFGLAGLRQVEWLCGDVERVLPALEAAARRFDFVMEDAMHAEPAARAAAVTRRLAALLAPGGALVLNRHIRHRAAATAALRRVFARVTTERVRRDAGNVLICASGPRADRSRRPIARKPAPGRS